MRIIIYIALASATTSAACKDQKYVCPEELPAVAVKIVEAPPGWSGYVPERFPLRLAGVTVGYLEHSGMLLGEQTKLKGGSFRVDYPNLGARKEEKWLTCDYDGHVLGHRLPDDTARCTMVYTPDGQGSYKINITCG